MATAKKPSWDHREPSRDDPKGGWYPAFQEQQVRELEGMLGNLTEALNQKGMDGDLYVGAYVRPTIQKLHRRAASVKLLKDRTECHILDTVYAFTDVNSRLDSLNPGHDNTNPLTPIVGAVGRKAEEDLEAILFNCGCEAYR